MICENCQSKMMKNGTRKKTISIKGREQDIVVQKWICHNNHTSNSIKSDTTIMQNYHDELVSSIMKSGFQETSREFDVSRHYLYGLYDKWMTLHKYTYEVYPQNMAICSMNLSGNERYALIDMDNETILDIITDEEELFQTYTNDICAICVDVNQLSKNIAYTLNKNVIINTEHFKHFCLKFIEKKFNNLIRELQIPKNNNYNLNFENFCIGDYDFWPDDFIELYKNIEWLTCLNDNPPQFLKNIYNSWKIELEKGKIYKEYNFIWEKIEKLKKNLEDKNPQKKWILNKGFILHYDAEEVYDDENRLLGVKINL